MEVSADAHSEVTGDTKKMTARCLGELSAAHQPEDPDLATFSFVIDLWKLCRVFYPRHTVFWKHYDVPKHRDQGPQQRPYNFRAWVPTKPYLNYDFLVSTLSTGWE